MWVTALTLAFKGTVLMTISTIALRLQIVINWIPTRTAKATLAMQMLMVMELKMTLIIAR